MKTLNTAVVGIGNMGSAHASCIGGGNIKGMVLYALCDIRQDILESACSRYGVKAYADWQDVVRDKSVDVVVIAVPHPLHADIAIAALNAGKHVLVEKPVDIRVSKAVALGAAAKKSGKTFGIMFLVFVL